jgi:hypothetical protein
VIYVWEVVHHRHFKLTEFVKVVKNLVINALIHRQLVHHVKEVIWLTIHVLKNVLMDTMLPIQDNVLDVTHHVLFVMVQHQILVVNVLHQHMFSI